jgi:hypothetical protein
VEHADLLAGLRSLGCRGELARRAAEFSQSLPGATLEERLRAALQFIGKGSVQRGTPVHAPVHDGTPARGRGQDTSLGLTDPEPLHAPRSERPRTAPAPAVPV